MSQLPVNPSVRIRAVAVMAAVFLSAAISTSAQAADPETGGARIYGPGGESCGTWLEQRGNSVLHNTDLAWVLGYLTAWNAFAAGAGGHIRRTDSNAVSAYVDKYCRENPLKQLMDASQALVMELVKPEEPPPK